MSDPNIAACLSDAIGESLKSYAWVADKVQVSEYTVRRWCSGLAVPGGQSIMRLRRYVPGFARRLDAPEVRETSQNR